jgi:diguanylate cyclase (GGDEF)-like protein/PAS domain S-box-containing protein
MKPESVPVRPVGLFESMYALAAEGGAAALAVTRTRKSLRVAWANAAALRLLGVASDDLLGADIAPDAPARPGDLCQWAKLVWNVLSGGVDPALDEWHSTAIDTPHHSASCVQVMVSAAPGGIYVVWLRPVADGQRVAEEAQRESEHRFSALAEHAPVGIVVSEAGVRLGFVNNRFAEIVGVDRSELSGTEWLKTVHAPDLPGLLTAVDEVLGGTPVELRLRLVSIDDAQRWVQMRLSPVITPRRSAGFIATVEDITARRVWETQLSYLASHDSLTGLANRRILIESLSQLLSSRRRRARGAAVLFCDLDGFKQINDTLGHDAGDRVLIEVGHRLSSTAREHDLVARIAGDEFVVLIRQIDSLADAEAAAGRLLAALSVPITIAGQPITAAASIGIAMADEYNNTTDLLHAADRRMYQAKSCGGGIFRSAALDTDARDVS